MKDELKKRILRDAADAHDKINSAWMSTFFPLGNDRKKKKFLKLSRKFNALVLERYISTATDEEGQRLLRQVNNTPSEFAATLRDVWRILQPERRGRQPILSDKDRRDCCTAFDALRKEGNTRKAAAEKTAEQFGITPEQMEGILRHRNRYTNPATRRIPTVY